MTDLNINLDKVRFYKGSDIILTANIYVGEIKVALITGRSMALEVDTYSIFTFQNDGSTAIWDSFSKIKLSRDKSWHPGKSVLEILDTIQY